MKYKKHWIRKNYNLFYINYQWQVLAFKQFAGHTVLYTWNPIESLYYECLEFVHFKDTNILERKHMNILQILSHDTSSTSKFSKDLLPERNIYEDTLYSVYFLKKIATVTTHSRLDILSWNNKTKSFYVKYSSKRHLHTFQYMSKLKKEAGQYEMQFFLQKEHYHKLLTLC